MSSRVTPEAISDYHSGMSVAEILAKYGISKTQFYRRLNQASVEKRGPIPSFSEPQLAALVADYQAGLTQEELAAKYERAVATVVSALRSTGVELRSLSDSLRLYADAEIEQCIVNYLSGLSAHLSGSYCGASEATVLRWLHDRGIDRRHQPDYGGDKHFFSELDSERKLYWFGFLCADGSLTAKKYVRTLLSSKDKEHLELLHFTLGYRKKIAVFRRTRHWPDRPAREYEFALSLIGSVQMVRDLRRHGMARIKNGDIRPLFWLNDQQIKHFIRGYFDGDGSVCLKKIGDWQWYICGPSRLTLEYLMSRCPIVTRHNAVIQRNGHHHIWRVVYGGNKIVPKICEWMYSNSSIWLERKHEIAVCCH